MTSPRDREPRWREIPPRDLPLPDVAQRDGVAREATARASVPPAVEGYTRWPGLLALAFGWLGAPLALLLNEQISYLAAPWACFTGKRIVLHIVPIIFLVVAALAALAAWRGWQSAGDGYEDEADTISTRTRFLGILGVGTAALFALMILAQWLAMFVVDPCART